jgi:hypothetical protein
MPIPSKRLTATVCVALVAGGAAVGEAALPKKGRAYIGEVPTTGGLGVVDPSHAQVILKVSASGKRLRADGPSLCGRNPHPVIKGIKISRKGGFKAERSYTDTRSSGEKFAWKFKIAGRFTSSKRAKGVLTEHLETSDYNRGESNPGVEGVCDTPKNLRWKVKLFSG